MKSNIQFNKLYKTFNFISLFLIIFSLIILVFKGLNYGVDFKGGTLIELRTNDTQITITKLRNSFLNMNLGDVSVKKFGNETDYLIKFEKKRNDNNNFINEIKDELTLSIGKGSDFRRVENVGPKVSAELLKSGIIAICILIVAIPEGLPLAVSVAMALSITKMKNDKILIKNVEIKLIVITFCHSYFFGCYAFLYLDKI